MASAYCLTASISCASRSLGRGVVGELAVNGGGLGRLAILFVQAGQLEQRVAYLGSSSAARRKCGAASAEFPWRASAWASPSSEAADLGSSSRARDKLASASSGPGLQLRFGQVESRTELFGLLLGPPARAAAALRPGPSGAAAGWRR